MVRAKVPELVRPSDLALGEEELAPALDQELGDLSAMEWALALVAQQDPVCSLDQG